MIHKKKKPVTPRIEDKIQKEWKYLRHIKIKDENHLLFASFVILMAALLVVNTIYIMNRVPDGWLFMGRHTTSAPDTSTILTSQQAAVTDIYHINISNVTEKDTKDPAFTLADDQTMLIFDISITNKTAVTQNIVPVNQLFIHSRDGDLATMHPSSLLTKPLAAGTVAPGATVSGQVSFGVPKSLAHPLLYVDLGWNDYVPIVYDVMR